MSTASSPGATLDVRAHRLGPRLGAEDADAHRAELAAASRPCRCELLDDHLHVAGRDHDDVGPEVDQQLHLLLGLATGHRDHRAAQPFGPVVRAQAAGEETVAVGHVDHVAASSAGRMDGTGDEVGPGVDVVLRVADDGRLAGRARRRVDADHLFARHGEHAERVVGPQILLGRERELREVGQLPQVVGMHAGRVEGLRGSARPARRRGRATCRSRVESAARRSRRDSHARSDRGRRGPCLAASGRPSCHDASSARTAGLAASSCRSGRGTPRWVRRPGCVTAMS